MFVDLLTPADLELLRSKRASSGGATAAAPAPCQPQPQREAQAQPGQAAPTGAAPSAAGSKRYLILTYAAEFDRVHYPLPLQYEEHPDPQRLKATIRQLRAQLAAATARAAGGLGRRGGSAAAAPADVKQLSEENAALRAQVQELEAAQGLGGGSSLAADVQQLAADAQETVRDLRAMRRERDGLVARLQQAEAALEGERNLHRRELRRRGKDVADLGGELAAAKDQIRELRLKCRELTQELDLAQRRAKVASMRWVAEQGGAGARLSYGCIQRLRAPSPLPGMLVACPAVQQPAVAPVCSASLARQPSAGRPPGSSGGGGGASSSRGSLPSYSRGTSPAGSRYHSRDASPAPIRRVPLPGDPRLLLRLLGSRACAAPPGGACCHSVLRPFLLQARPARGRPTCPAPPPSPRLAPAQQAASTPQSTSSSGGSGSGRRRGGWTTCGVRHACSRRAPAPAACTAPARPPCPPHVRLAAWLGTGLGRCRKRAWPVGEFLAAPAGMRACGAHLCLAPWLQGTPHHSAAESPAATPAPTGRGRPLAITARSEAACGRGTPASGTPPCAAPSCCGRRCRPRRGAAASRPGSSGPRLLAGR